MAKVVMEKLNKHFGGVKAVRDFDLEIPDKEFMVLVGPSGCGKTTTLRMVAGLEDITAGDIYIDDKVVNHLPPKDRDIAMVFQNYALYPHMTVYQNMAFGLTLRKVPKEEIVQRGKEAAEILNIGELLQRKPKALSGGQRQRVAVGRAIVRKPKVFLFDEPLPNLDAKLRVQMRGEISKLHQNLGATMIYVTHDQTEAMTMGDRIVVMKDGLVNQFDTPMNLYNKPVNQFVAGFIGSPSMNFIEGKLFQEDGLSFKSKGNYLTLKLNETLGDRLKNYISKSLWLGIRPEDIYDSDSSNRNNNAKIDVQLEVVEPMGNEIFLYFTIDDSQFIARIPAREKPEPNAKRTLSFDLGKLYFFDIESEKSI